MTRPSMIVGSAGIVVLATSAVWFTSYYTKAAQLVGHRGPLPIQCLYSNDGICGLVTGVGAFAGANPYQPGVFWLGLVLIALAAILDLPIWPESGSRPSVQPPVVIESSPMSDALPGPERLPDTYLKDALPEGWSDSRTEPSDKKAGP